MLALEANWLAIRTALVRTIELAASFGLNGQTLKADSSLLPIAYYLYHRKVHANYVTHSQYNEDRNAIRGWLVRSIVKASGIWGSGLDTLLTALREVIKSSDTTEFPAAQLRHVMSQRGKSLTFEPAEIEDLLHLEYGDKRLFPLLSLLFPFADLRNQFHVDHVFPSSRFTVAKLQLEGFSEDVAKTMARHINTLANLQLLEGAINNEKRAALPTAWLASYLPDPMAHQHYRTKHDLGNLPDGLEGFEAFWSVRRDKLRNKLAKLLCSPPAAPSADFSH